MTSADEEVIELILNRIVEKFKPEKVILFGSYARGNPSPDSDIDLLVIMDFSGRRTELIRRIRKSLRDISVPKDVIVRTPKEIREYGQYIGTIIYPALQEGKVLYAAD